MLIPPERHQFITGKVGYKYQNSGILGKSYKGVHQKVHNEIDVRWGKLKQEYYRRLRNYRG